MLFWQLQSIVICSPENLLLTTLIYTPYCLFFSIHNSHKSLTDFPESSQVSTCANFDYSVEYTVDCPDSTMCYKKIVSDVFYKRPFVREERGCAPQLYQGQKFDDTYGWSSDTRVVNDAYPTGCHKVESYGLRTLDVQECYCDQDLCNSSWKCYVNCVMLIVWVAVIYF